MTRRQHDQYQAIGDPITSDWLEMSRSIGIGDALWMMTTFLIGKRENMVHIGNFWLPFVIGPLVGVINYYLQKRHCKQSQSATPKDLMQNTAGLGFEMGIGILGWEAGVSISEYAMAHLKDLNPTAYYLTSAMLAGIGEAIGVGLTNTALDWVRKGKKQSTLLTTVKLLTTCFISGALWYGISQINFDKHFSGKAATAMNTSCSTLLTFLVVTITFSMMKPIDSWRSFKMGTQSTCGRLFKCCGRGAQSGDTPMSDLNGDVPGVRQV